MSEPFEIFMRSLRGMGRAFVANLPALFAGLLVFGFFVLLSRIAVALTQRAGRRVRMDESLSLLLGRLASFILLLLGGLVAAVIVFPTFRPGDLIAGLGITTVAVGFAFKDVLQNFFAGVLILWRRPFHVGDEIVSGDYEGIVEDINTRSTQIRTWDGEKVILPNGDVFARAILVRKDRRRGQLVVGIGYEESIDDAEAAILASVRDVEGVLEDPPPAAYVSEFGAATINLTVYFWIVPRKSSFLKVKDRVAVAIKRALGEAGIEMPNPNTVVMVREEAGADPDVPRREPDNGASLR